MDSYGLGFFFAFWNGISSVLFIAAVNEGIAPTCFGIPFVRAEPRDACAPRHRRPLQSRAHPPHLSSLAGRFAAHPAQRKGLSSPPTCHAAPAAFLQVVVGLVFPAFYGPIAVLIAYTPICVNLVCNLVCLLRRCGRRTSLLAAPPNASLQPVARKRPTAAGAQSSAFLPQTAPLKRLVGATKTDAIIELARYRSGGTGEETKCVVGHAIITGAMVSPDAAESDLLVQGVPCSNVSAMAAPAPVPVGLSGAETEASMVWRTL